MSAPTDAARRAPPGPRAPARPPPFSRLALATAALALVVVLVALLAGLGSRWGWWHFRTGFSMLRWAAYGGIAIAVLAVVALVRARPGAGRRGWPLAAAALVISLVLVGSLWSLERKAGSAPPIHDITTDAEDPPRFAAIAPLRADAPNPIEYGGAEVAAQQQAAYPQIRPVVLDLPPDRAFQRALDLARRMGWEIVAADAEAGRIEATDRTFWFGFEDDVVIRLTPLDGRTVVDVRSVSRVGRGDAGTNARRVQSFLDGLRA